jgi:hypothetical protein
LVKYDGDDETEEYSLYEIKDMFKHVVTTLKSDTTSAAPLPSVEAIAAAPLPTVEENVAAAPLPTVEANVAAPLSTVDAAALFHTDEVSAAKPVLKERIVIDLTNVKKSNDVAESLYSLVLRQSTSCDENNHRGEITATFMNEGKKMKVIFVEDVDDNAV